MKERTEIWKDVPNHLGYEVSSRGRVRSRWKQGHSVLSRGPERFVAQWENRGGYLICDLKTGNGRRHRAVHQLVLEAFVGARPGRADASHPDGNRKNNLPENLVWESRRENHGRKRAHGTHMTGERIANAKLRADDVGRMRTLYAAGAKQSTLSEQFGVSQGHVSALVRGVCWKIGNGTIADSAKGCPGQRHGKAKFSDEEVTLIRKRAAEGVAQKRLAETYNVSPSTIWHIIHRKTWAHVD